MGRNKGKKVGESTREKQQKQVQIKADWLRPVLKLEKGWNLATGTKKPKTKKEINLKRRAVTRLTKKAVKLMLPEEECSVRYGRGSTLHWVEVNLKVSPDISKTSDKTKARKQRELVRKVKDTLIALNLSYATFQLNPHSEEESHPCLSISVRDKT